MAIAEYSTISGTPLDLVELRHKRRESALAQLLSVASARRAVRQHDVLLASLARRARLGTSALGRGVAVPHAHSLLVARPYVLVGRSPRGLEWDAADEQPVHLVALVLSPADLVAERHFQRVAHVVHVLRQQRQRQRLLDAADRDVVALLLREAIG